MYASAVRCCAAEEHFCTARKPLRCDDGTGCGALGARLEMAIRWDIRYMLWASVPATAFT